MRVLDDINRLLTQRGLLPPFTSPYTARVSPSAWLWPVVFVRSLLTAVTGGPQPPPGSYCMDAPAMHLEQHERGNHVVFMELSQAVAVNRRSRQSPETQEHQVSRPGHAPPARPPEVNENWPRMRCGWCWCEGCCHVTGFRIPRNGDILASSRIKYQDSTLRLEKGAGTVEAALLRRTWG